MLKNIVVVIFKLKKNEKTLNLLNPVPGARWSGEC